MDAEAITFDPHAVEDETTTGIPHDKMGMWVFLCSEVMFFTGLIGSSVTMVKALEWIQRGDTRKMKLFMCLTLAGGSIFLGVQVFEYRHLLHEGFNPHVSLFGSTFYTMTGFHGFHVFCGVVCIAFCTGKAFLGKYTQQHHLGIETLGLYWHFVDLVWILLFAIVYLI
jgi:cytochrome c oxidase subunit 3